MRGLRSLRRVVVLTRPLSSVIRRNASTVTVLAVGKSPGAWIADGAAEYEKRLNGSGSVKVQTLWIKSDADLIERSNKVKGKVVALRCVGTRRLSCWDTVLHELTQTPCATLASQ